MGNESYLTEMADKHEDLLYQVHPSDREMPFLMQMRYFERVEFDRVVKTTLTKNQPKKDNANAKVWQTLFKETMDTTYRQHHKVFTDASKTATNVAFAVYDETDSEVISEGINNNFSITNAELLGILKTVELIKNKGYKKAVILTDSRSACDMLLNEKSFEENYVLAEVYKEFYGMRGNNIRIQWIPSHMGIQGSEKVDQEAVNQTRLPQTFFNTITMSDALVVSKQGIWDEWTRKYQRLSNDKGKWHFQIQERPYNRKIWSKNLLLNPDEIKTLSRIRTGHCLTKERKAMWGLEKDDQCEWCETTGNLKHILYDCPRYNQSRVEHSALEYMKPLETILLENFEEELKQIVHFLKVNQIHI
ncbi:uncharacterized protein LOC115267823 [Aedes albopictus]|uniref:RNase H type-1 domain-containing protein n=1 Tax=Aedes albopictus TaxID=7160 RepID=A0ABM1Z2I0_AEDAL